MTTFSTGKAARFLGVSIRTLQQWDRDGRLKAHRLPSGRRRYTEEQLFEFLGRKAYPIERITVGYVRVSSQAQRPDMRNQRIRLEEFCDARGLIVDEWVEEVGGGLNFKRPTFLSLIDRIVAGRIERLVVAHKDRLARFGFDLLRHLAAKHNCELVVLNTEALSPEREMVEDLMAITHCFSARLYGLRNYRKAMREAIKRDAAASA